jgi:hypothetical protein
MDGDGDGIGTGAADGRHWNGMPTETRDTYGLSVPTNFFLQPHLRSAAGLYSLMQGRVRQDGQVMIEWNRDSWAVDMGCGCGQI